MSDEDIVDWYCTALIEDADFRTRGVAEKAKLWKGKKQLAIGFLGGSPKLQDRVLATAKRWTKEGEGGANLTFVKAPDAADGDIRVSFDANGGSWSFIGTDAKDPSRKGKATMNLGWVAEKTAEKTFASVVLHEFGHAIGLLHEHNHPDAVINWNKDAVYADLMGPPNNWSKATIDFNVFESYDPKRVIKSMRPDMVSIMIYTIPARWLRGGQKGIMPGDSLSRGDKTFIRDLYP